MSTPTPRIQRIDYYIRNSENACAISEAIELQEELTAALARIAELESEIRHIVSTPNGIRSHEGGAEENLAQSLALTWAKACADRESLTRQLASAREDGERLIDAITSVTDWKGTHVGDVIAAIDSARGVTSPPSVAETGEKDATPCIRWSYSSYRATLKLDGKHWAIVSPDGRNALSAADAALLERAMNSLDASLLPPPPQGKEQGK